MLRVHLAVEAARGRGQDRAAAWVAPGRTTLGLADGAGGMAGGEEAAEAALRGLAAWHDAPVGSLAALMTRLDAGLARAGTGGETTCVALAWADDGITGASVGDSEAWLVGPDRVVELTGGQAKKPLLGSGRARPVGFAARPAAARLLVASDGLFKYAPRAGVLELVRRAPLEAAPGLLVALARLPSGGLPDDVAVMVAEARP